MIFSIDYMRSKLLDHYVDLQTKGKISEEVMEDRMDRVELMDAEQIRVKFNKIFRKRNGPQS